MNVERRVLTSGNIDRVLSSRTAQLEDLGRPIVGLKGLDMLQALKRKEVGSGPYPHVTLSEAANRIMSDLVILHGVKWLLDRRQFPFDKYEVELGIEDKNGFDVRARSGQHELVGEAFNVARSHTGLGCHSPQGNEEHERTGCGENPKARASCGVHVGLRVCPGV
jgi:hypothetical protein